MGCIDLQIYYVLYCVFLIVMITPELDELIEATDRHLEPPLDERDSRLALQILINLGGYSEPVLRDRVEEKLSEKGWSDQKINHELRYLFDEHLIEDASIGGEYIAIHALSSIKNTN